MKNEIDFYLQNAGEVKISKLTKADLKILISTGESLYLEFKHKVASPEKIAREMCALANSKGGKILIGVSDNGVMLGVESFLEEEFWLNMAAKEVCVPEIDFTMELLHLGPKDIMIVDVPEAENKPVYVKTKNKRTVFIRHIDESVTASENRIEILKNENSDEEVTFEYGEREQLLFRFLNEYGEITVERFSTLINVTTYRASKILVNLTCAGILNLFERDNVEYYTFTAKSA
ncbi:MAG: ATP-binding protein [Balneolaceae bacterium]